MPWWNWALFAVSLAAFLGCAWWYYALFRTRIKRLQLIDRYKISGDWRLASEEFEAVGFSEHLSAVFWLRDPRRLYGPLIQGVWDSDTQKAYHDFWWKCYKEIYLKAPKQQQGNINRFLPSRGLTATLTSLGYDLDYLLLAADPPPKFSMVDGAEEYEQIMAMQEIGL